MPALGKKKALVEIGDKPLSPQQAGQFSGLANALEEVNQAERMILDAKGDVDRTVLFQSALNLPFSPGREFNQVIDNAIATKLRIETGAAANKDEVVKIAGRFSPSINDSAKSIKGKFSRFRKFMQGAISLADPSGKLRFRFYSEQSDDDDSLSNEALLEKLMKAGMNREEALQEMVTTWRR